MTQLSDLRAEVFTQAGGWCEFPSCDERADELAHIKHRGMGGNKKANTPDNVLAFCRDHHRKYDDARLTSGDVNDLLSDTWRPEWVGDVFGCAFRDCRLPVTVTRTVLPGHISWRAFPLCDMHALVTDMTATVPGRRHHFQTLLRVLAERRMA